MEFIFDKVKLAKEGYDEEQCLNLIRYHFKEYNSKTIKETRKVFFLKELIVIGMLLVRRQKFLILIGF